MYGKRPSVDTRNFSDHSHHHVPDSSKCSCAIANINNIMEQYILIKYVRSYRNDICREPPPPPPPPPPTTHPCSFPLVRLHWCVLCPGWRVGRCAKKSGACEESWSTADTPLPWNLLGSCEIGARVRVSAVPHSAGVECCIPSDTLPAERRHNHCHISVVRCTVPADAGTGCVVRILRCRPGMLESRTERGCSHCHTR